MVGSAGIADKTKHGWAWEIPGQKRDSEREEYLWT